MFAADDLVGVGLQSLGGRSEQAADHPGLHRFAVARKDAVNDASVDAETLSGRLHALERVTRPSDLLFRAACYVLDVGGWEHLPDRR